MPELPEVETTRRGIEPALAGQRVRSLVVHDARLRWPIEKDLTRALAGQRILAVDRRAKYLLLRVELGTLILHLGMSGSLRLLRAGTPRLTHDRYELLLQDTDQTLRFNDPRRFGSLHYTVADPGAHRLLRDLAPEPFDARFDPEYLWRITRGRRVSIKQLLMNGRLVTGVGNIYASEALFRAHIDPRRRAGGLKRVECGPLVRAIRAVLNMAIRAGGTTLRDYVGADGNPGYFRQKLYVYERDGAACRNCGTPIRRITQGQRSTYFCNHCQH